jgi:UDP-N-acetylglucosamine 2-epimerase (non-hydrolysing)
VLLPYTHRSKENLLREGIERRRIFVTGNPIREVIEAHRTAIESSHVLDSLQVSPRAYALATVHRAENVDDTRRLFAIVESLDRVVEGFGLPVIVSVHPRTADRMSRAGIAPRRPEVRLLAPLGFLDFVRLEQDARVVLTDSGTVQEECCILGIPNVTIRNATERPETIECGSNILAGVEPAGVVAAVRQALRPRRTWLPPEEYLRLDVASTVVKILTMTRPDA